MKTENEFVDESHFVIAPHRLRFAGLQADYRPRLKRKNQGRTGIYTVRDLCTG